MTRSRLIVLGGLAQSLVNFRGPLIRELQTFAEVIAVSGEPDDKTIATLESWSVPFVEVPLQRNSISIASDGRLLLTLLQLFRRQRPDVVFAYTVKPIVFGLIAARLAGVKHRTAMITGLGFGLTGSSRRRKILAALVGALYRLALRKADVVFFQNEDDRKLFVDRKLLDRRTQIEIVRGSGVDVQHFSSGPPRVAGLVKFVFVGRYSVEKGLADFVEAVRICKQSHNQRFRAEIAGWTDSVTGIPQDVITGWEREELIVDRGRLKDIRPFLEESHVLVLPSYREGTPRSVLEAMAMSRATIVTDVTGCRDAVIGEITSLIVPPRSPSSLAIAMARLIDDPDLISTLGKNGRSHVLAHYEASAVATHMAGSIRKEL